MDQKILSILSLHLDPPDTLGNDWRLLADDFGLNARQVAFFASKADPTSSVIIHHQKTTGKSSDEIVTEVRSWALTVRRIDVKMAIDKFREQKKERENSRRAAAAVPKFLKDDSVNGRIQSLRIDDLSHCQNRNQPRGMNGSSPGVAAHAYSGTHPDHRTAAKEQMDTFLNQEPFHSQIPYDGAASIHAYAGAYPDQRTVAKDHMDTFQNQDRLHSQNQFDHVHSSDYGSYGRPTLSPDISLGHQLESMPYRFPHSAPAIRHANGINLRGGTTRHAYYDHHNASMTGPIPSDAYGLAPVPYEALPHHRPRSCSDIPVDPRQSQFKEGYRQTHSYPSSTQYQLQDACMSDPYCLQPQLSLPIDYEQKGNEMRRILKKSYNEKIKTWKPVPTLKHCRWFRFKDIFTSLQLRRGFQGNDPVCDVQDIYKGAASSFGVNRRTLLLGEPGIGKTVVCLKHLIDYIMPCRESIHGIGKFDLIFLIELRHATLPVESSIHRQRFPLDSSISEDVMWAVIRQMQDKVLFIFDGFDELRVEVVEEWTCWIRRVLEGSILSDVSVLLTSRMHQVEDIDEYFDVSLVNLGYKRANSEEFVRNFFKTEGFESSVDACNVILEKIQNDPVIAELAKNPLSLTLLCLLATESSSLPKSVTELYEILVHSMIKRHMKDRSKSHYTSSHLLSELEKLAYRKIDLNQTIFDFESIECKEVCDLGFFCTKFTTVYLVEKKFCEFIHQSFQDYFASRAYCFSSSQGEQMRHVQRLVEEGRLHLMCQYICGMMDLGHPTLDALIHHVCCANKAKHKVLSEGKIQNYQLSLRCLAELRLKAGKIHTHVQAGPSVQRELNHMQLLTSQISQSLPDVLEITYSQCTLVILEMIPLLLRDPKCGVRHLNLCIDGLHQKPDLALELAAAISRNTTITRLSLSQCFMDDTPFFVRFMLTMLEHNSCVNVLKLVGWMNKARNLTEDERRLTFRLFSNDALQVKTLILQHFDNHRRVGYILDCFPPRFDIIEILNSNLETATDAIVHKIQTSDHLDALHLKNDCFFRPGMRCILQALVNTSLFSLTLSSIYTSAKKKKVPTATLR